MQNAAVSDRHEDEFVLDMLALCSTSLREFCGTPVTYVGKKA